MQVLSLATRLRNPSLDITQAGVIAKEVASYAVNTTASIGIVHSLKRLALVVKVVQVCFGLSCESQQRHLRISTLT